MTIRIWGHNSTGTIGHGQTGWITKRPADYYDSLGPGTHPLPKSITVLELLPDAVHTLFVYETSKPETHALDGVYEQPTLDIGRFNHVIVPHEGITIRIV